MGKIFYLKMLYFKYKVVVSQNKHILNLLSYNLYMCVHAFYKWFYSHHANHFPNQIYVASVTWF